MSKSRLVSDRLLALADPLINKDNISQDDYAKAVQYIDAAWRADKSNYRVYSTLDKIFKIDLAGCKTEKQSNEIILKAIETFQNAIREVNDNDIKLIFAEYCLKLPQYHGLACQYANEALTAKPTLKLYEIAGDCEVANNNHDKALLHYNEALKLSDNGSELMPKLAYCYLSKGDYQQATTYVNQALALDPDNELAGHMLKMIKAKSKHKSG